LGVQRDPWQVVYGSALPLEDVKSLSAHQGRSEPFRSLRRMLGISMDFLHNFSTRFAPIRPFT
jgi:hypothetical protein